MQTYWKHTAFYYKSKICIQALTRRTSHNGYREIIIILERNSDNTICSFCSVTVFIRARFHKTVVCHVAKRVSVLYIFLVVCSVCRVVTSAAVGRLEFPKLNERDSRDLHPPAHLPEFVRIDGFRDFADIILSRAAPRVDTSEFECSDSFVIFPRRHDAESGGCDCDDPDVRCS